MHQRHWTQTDRRAAKLDPLLRRKIRQLDKSAASMAGIFSRTNQFLTGGHLLPILVESKTVQSHAEIHHICRRHRVEPSRYFSIVNCCTAKATATQIRNMLDDPNITRIHYDRPVRILLDVAAPSVGVPLAWESGLTGRGIRIAIIDTGIYPHPDFNASDATRNGATSRTKARSSTTSSRIVAFQDYIHNRKTPYDDNGHGTHVAGIAAGNGSASGGRYRGIAPEAELVVIKALDANGSGLLSNLIAAIEWTVTQREKYNIRILNLSLGSEAFVPCSQDPLCQAANLAWQAGIVVCAAAGNSGPEPSTIASPGISPQIITVGACDDRQSDQQADDTLALFSSRGPTIEGLNKPDLLCPGQDIMSLRAPGSRLDRQFPGREPYMPLSGTSMATPICSGVAALLLQQQPRRTPNEVKRLLLGACVSIGLSRNEQGHGVLRTESLWAAR